MSSVRYVLKVYRDVRLLEYSPRLKVMRNLTATIYKHRMSHPSMKEAIEAAKVISKNPLVTGVAVVRVEESEPMVFHNGERFRS